MATKYVLIGNSAASLAAVDGIRKFDKQGEITIINRETGPAYSRVALPYYVAGEMTLDDLHLFLNAPGAGSAGIAGGHPEPGGWNRFMLVTDDLDAKIRRLRSEGAGFRGDVAEAGAGRQILLEDPSGNVVELFEYRS